MTTDEELQVAADSLAESVQVVGVDTAGVAAADRLVSRDVPATDTAPDPDAVVLAADAATPTHVDSLDTYRDHDAPIRIAVITLPSQPAPHEREFLEKFTQVVDTVILAPGSGTEALTTAGMALVSLIREPGFVNLDLADARTILTPGDLAALGVGETPDGSPATAVADAFASLPTGLKTDPANGVLIDLIGGPEMSVTDVSEGVTAVRERVGPDAHVIWGGGIKESLTDGIRVRLIIANISNIRAAPGDPCPRCENTLSTYALGEQTTITCDQCGYAGVSVRLR